MKFLNYFFKKQISTNYLIFFSRFSLLCVRFHSAINLDDQKINELNVDMFFNKIQSDLLQYVEFVLCVTFLSIEREAKKMFNKMSLILVFISIEEPMCML